MCPAPTPSHPFSPRAAQLQAPCSSVLEGEEREGHLWGSLVGCASWDACLGTWLSPWPSLGPISLSLAISGHLGACTWSFISWGASTHDWHSPSAQSPSGPLRSALWLLNGSLRALLFPSRSPARTCQDSGLTLQDTPQPGPEPVAGDPVCPAARSPAQSHYWPQSWWPGWLATSLHSCCAADPYWPSTHTLHRHPSTGV